MPRKKILYASFDEVPAPKGASTHILQFTAALGAGAGDVVLATPGSDDQPLIDIAPGVQQIVLGSVDDNPFGRARTFRKKLANLLKRQVFQIIHFRSIFEGIIAINPGLNRQAKLVYEVNGFPSIEMKYLYPALLDCPKLVDKLRRQEDRCLNSVDQIVTVSQTNGLHIESRLHSSIPISVIPNGADLEAFQYQKPSPLDDGPIRIVYVGTTAPWQGIQTLLEAIELVNKNRPVQLTIVGAVSGRRYHLIQKKLTTLEIESLVDFKQASSKPEVGEHFHAAHMTVVPLLNLDRNTVQGCSPIKLIEAMASGCPVIASNLPIVRELATPDINFLPAKPGDARNLKNLILQLADDDSMRERLSNSARRNVEEKFTWNIANEKLIDLYRKLSASNLLSSN